MKSEKDEIKNCVKGFSVARALCILGPALQQQQQQQTTTTSISLRLYLLLANFPLMLEAYNERL
jgi:hypothetical protein